MIRIIYVLSVLSLLACNSKPAYKESSSSTADDNKQFVRATVNGKPWASKPEEVLATYSHFDDRLQIFTKDAAGKTNVLLTAQPFSKTGAGTYNSVKENAGGFGISLIDDNSADNDVLDYDNFRQGAAPDCITITAIKETAEGKMISGSFSGDLHESNNYTAGNSKTVNINGEFAVMLKK